MLRNYIKIAWRNILKSRFYSLLNVAGLTSGLAFTMLIMAYVWNELQVNAHLNNASRQYILKSNWKDPNMGFELATIGALPKALKEEYPTLVKNYYRWDGVTTNVAKGEKSFREGLQIGDSTFLTMYGFKLLHGDATTALKDPFSVVIMEDVAKKFFGKTDVVGETLNLENFSGAKKDFVITAVLKTPWDNSVTHLNANNRNTVFLPMSSLAFFNRDIESWNNPYVVSFLELQPGVKTADVDKAIQQLLKQNTPPQVADNIHPQMIQLQTLYLDKDKGLVRKMLYTLSAIAFFILLMAVINFVNMSVSRSATRLKEIGVRKVLGGLKRQLVWQFLTESTILVAFSSLLAILVYPLAKPLFSRVLENPLPAISELPLYFAVYPLLLVLFTGFAAGVYPAFVLSSLKSIDSLKGKMKTVKENVLLRRSLVGFQFFTAAVVLIGAFIISTQVKLFFSKDLGYDKSYIVSAQLPRNWTPEGVTKMEGIREQFAAMPEVKGITLSFEVPDGNNGNNQNVRRANADSATAVTSYLLVADENYAQTYGIPMAAGRFFAEKGMAIDSSRVVINETLAKAVGFKDPAEAVGQQVKLAENVLTVGGVVRDFHFGSMQKSIQPIIFLHVQQFPLFRYFSIKLNPGNPQATLATLQRKWAELMPGTPFEYKFMDDTLASLYKTELQLKQAAYIATVLAFVIVLLGVLGIISLSVHKRAKEIGIRKVLGASVGGIVALFVKDMLLVVTVAALVACPVAYYIMQQWLNGYVYRIGITAHPFIITIASLMLITLVLVVAQTIKTALMNPVKSLRTE